MFKKIIVLTLAMFLIGSQATLAIENDHSKGKQNVPVEHGHWYKGEVIKKNNYDSLWNIAVNLKESPKGNEILNNCIKQYGSIDHLKKLEKLEIEYSSKSLLNDNTHNIQLYYNSDLKYKKIIIISDSIKVTTTLNGNKAQKIVNDISVQLDKREYKSELFSYLALTMPTNANLETFSEIRYGTRVEDSLNYLYLKKDDTLLMILGIDPNSNYIKKIEGAILQDESITVFINYFSKFKEYQGFIVPSKKMNVSMGLKMSEYTVTSVKINGLLDKDLFRTDENNK